MVESGHTRDEPVRVPYDAGRGLAGAEHLTLDELRHRAPASVFAGSQRLELHLLVAVTAGRGEHHVDFERVPLEPGTVLWVRPGQVHRWGDLTAYEGELLLLSPDHLDADPEAAAVTREPSLPPLWPDPDGALARRLADIGRVQRGPAAEVVRAGVVRRLVAALLLEVTADARGCSSPPGVFDRFRADVERHYAHDREVASYAARLGYSPRTLARAARQATGRGAKEVLDDRVVLEARRLLAHSDLTVAAIGGRLGFPDAANFSKFFQARTGVLPGAFRRQVG